ncbi:ATP-dependent DNA helicase, RecQ family protein, partial [Vibrio parahaemolyticus VPTS-2010]
TRE